MQVTLKCFSQVKQALGQSELILELDENAKTDDLVTKVLTMAEGKLDKITLRVAVNQSYTHKNTLLKDGDEVALISPVQGG